MKKIISVILFVAINFFMFSFASSRTVVFDFFAQNFKDKVSIIRYYNGPDSAPQKGLGFFIFKEIIDFDVNSPEEIKLDYQSIKCYGKLQGWYVNLLRGNYIIPIHTSGLGWDVTGGLYTKCEGFTGGVFGQIFFESDGYTGSLTVGFKVDLTNNEILFGQGFKNWFVLYNGVLPIGFVYDNIGGIGFVGGDISTKLPSEIDDFFANEDDLLSTIKSVNATTITFENTEGEEWVVDRILNAIIENIIGIVGNYNISKDNFASDANRLQTIQSLGVNKADQTGKTRYGTVAGKNIDFASVVNKVKKNVEEICKGRWDNIYTNENLNYIEPIKCINTNGNSIEINIVFDPSQLSYSPVLVVKGGNNKVILQKSMIGNKYIEIYNDKGFILVDTNIDLVPIDANGNYNPTNPVTSGAIIKGIFIVNGLFGGWDGSNITSFPHKLYVHGGLVSLNTISEPAITRKNYLQRLIGIGNSDNINLARIFTWRCEPDGKGTDGVNCSNPEDKWYNNSLIFIRKHIVSKFLK